MNVVRRDDPSDAAGIIVELSGALDLSSLPAVSSAIERAISSTPTRVIVDLEFVDSIDASGVGMLSTARSQADSADIPLMFVGGAPELVGRLQRAGLIGSTR